MTEVTSVVPAVSGLAVSATPDGSYLTITNRTDETVIVLGYENEPYLKITQHGVWHNTRSPTTYLNADLVDEIPDAVDADAPPNWQPISSSDTYRFHDHRIHWGGNGRPAVVDEDPGEPHLIANWAVPLLVGGTPVTINGTLRWKPAGFPTWAVVFGVTCVLLLFAFGFAVVVDQRRSRARDNDDDDEALPEIHTHPARSPGDGQPGGSAGSRRGRLT